MAEQLNVASSNTAYDNCLVFSTIGLIHKHEKQKQDKAVKNCNENMIQLPTKKDKLKSIMHNCITNLFGIAA